MYWRLKPLPTLTFTAFCEAHTIFIRNSPLAEKRLKESSEAGDRQRRVPKVETSGCFPSAFQVKHGISAELRNERLVPSINNHGARMDAVGPGDATGRGLRPGTRPLSSRTARTVGTAAAMRPTSPSRRCCRTAGRGPVGAVVSVPRGLLVPASPCPSPSPWRTSSRTRPGSCTPAWCWSPSRRSCTAPCYRGRRARRTCSGCPRN